MESAPDTSSPPGNGAALASQASILQRMRLPLWMFLVLLVLLLAAIGWGLYSTSAADRRVTREREAMALAFEAERVALRKASADDVARQTAEVETLFGAALAWSVRGSMLRNNLDEVDQYFGDLVKNPRIPLVLLADADGKVLRATDRKYLDSDFATHFPRELLTGTDVAVHPDEGRRKRIVLPVQGLTARLGTVLLLYSPPD